jgi:hypothetical protein
VVDDFLTGRSWHSHLGDDAFVQVDANWDKGDQLLVELSRTRFFADCDTWSKLRPIHFKAMILRNFQHADQLSEEEFVEDHPTVLSLRFLIAGLVRCLRERADADVDMLKIRRVNKDTVNFDLVSSLNLELTDRAPPTGLQLVVDNTKK